MIQVRLSTNNASAISLIQESIVSCADLDDYDLTIVKKIIGDCRAEISPVLAIALALGHSRLDLTDRSTWFVDIPSFLTWKREVESRATKAMLS